MILLPPRWRLPCLVVSTAVSQIGDAVATMALVLDAARTGHPWNVTLVHLAALLPPIVLAPLLGLLVDRWDARKVWIATLAGQAAVFLAAVPTSSFGARVALVGAASVLGTAAASAGFKLLPTVVKADRLTSANAAVGAAGSVAGILGPALGGLLYVTAGTDVLLALNGGSFVVLALAAALSVPRPRRAVHTGLLRKPTAGITDGFRALRGAPLIAPLLPVLAAVMVGTSVEGVAGVFYLQDVTASDTAYGLVVASWAVGSVPGAMAAGLRRFEVRQPALALAGAALISLGLLAAGAVPVTAAVVVAFLCGGFGNGLHGVAVRNLVHQQVSPSVQGQAWAYYRVMANLSVTAGFILGTPAGPLTSRTLVLLSGAVPLAVTLVGALLLYRRARARAPLPGDRPADVDRTTSTR
ncbi:MFS transporter [Streptomyces sp. DH37]|uniref:MFS transporter n=1 Tax=Streptomyces sp. DH37 TaxID=3040122 RepID=UPI0024430D2C|nr:MFS transporter [Streptomyces sp. DH37]MDG9701538.1 MFS transporter [Streptomyces sp. DH37]